ncbi:SRPBCC family protein [Echinicola soli]|uniref:SRPBCC family protein n=1 Tax=Echinicola soli TaxID=2591634 RepID=A0A514CG74_9BACT|nr:SRPBCC family protein [Echinicola soli]QDH78827.1 SRPBCC family protein [Echinicola soli]
MGHHQLFSEQKIPATVEEVWDFISSPQNLKVITPDHMGFDITSKHLPEKMHPGMIISYKVSPILGIKMNWVTEITQVREKEFFVDEQRIGPYAMWHHQHHLEPIEGGVIMKDIVTYQPPFGPLGTIANVVFIRKQLASIFAYRFKAVEEKFGKFG